MELIGIVDVFLDLLKVGSTMYWGLCRACMFMETHFGSGC